MDENVKTAALEHARLVSEVADIISRPLTGEPVLALADMIVSVAECKAETAALQAAAKE